MEDLGCKKSSIVLIEEILTSVTVAHIVLEANFSEPFVTTDTIPGDYKLSSDQAIPSI